MLRALVVGEPNSLTQFSIGRFAVVKKGQLEVSKMDSPKQGAPRDPQGPKPKRSTGSQSQTRARPKSEGSGSHG